MEASIGEDCRLPLTTASASSDGTSMSRKKDPDSDVQALQRRGEHHLSKVRAPSQIAIQARALIDRPGQGYRTSRASGAYRTADGELGLDY
jgi:hypothetical protein